MVSQMDKHVTTLTSEEARILYTLANRMWVPGFAYRPLETALKKLLITGGGECCRDCSELGVTPHRLGGVVCRNHAPPFNPTTYQGNWTSTQENK